MSLSQLRRLAGTCDFGDNLDSSPRDRLVCGINEDAMQRRLLAEKTLDYNNLNFEWAAPIIPVLKSDQTSVRICGDYKMTVNQVAKPDCYPVPRIEDLFTYLSGRGGAFTKLDMSNAYQQLVLAEESRKPTTINTHTQGVVPVQTFTLRCISCSSNLSAYHGMYAARHSSCLRILC